MQAIYNDISVMRSRDVVCGDAGYGFVDFDTEQAAEVAVKALKAEGRQAQMARVSAMTLCSHMFQCMHDWSLLFLIHVFTVLLIFMASLCRHIWYHILIRQ